MPKKAKLSLDDLKVESFITSLNDSKALTVKGGIMSADPADTDNIDCCYDLSIPQSACYLCGSNAQGCDNSILDFCTFANNCQTGRQC